MFETDQAYEQFIGEFEARTLPKALWTHQAHLAGALWYLTRHEPAHALRIVRRNICAYNEAVGGVNDDHNGYHETLTQLFLRGVHAHHVQHAGVPLRQSLQALLASPLARSDWPLRFYSKEQLFSVAARRGWVAPDQKGERITWDESETTWQ